VLVASLVFWPVWIAVIGLGVIRVLSGDQVAEPSHAADRSGSAMMSLRAFPRRGGEALVASIARWKYHLLTYAALVAGALALTALFLFIAGEAERVRSAVGEVEGFVAIAGLVLGLPALAYAMVTDNTVGRIEDQMTRDRRKEIEARVGDRLRDFEDALPDHTVQVFLPDFQQTRLLPIYDPDRDGPDEGWAIERKTPQALTGSAWVGKTYLWGIGDELEQSKLRLTAAQRRDYEDLKAVAAAPISGRGHLDPLGVLTVYSRCDDQKIGTESFIHDHTEAARSLAWIIDAYVPERGPLSQYDLHSRTRP
jgi:hypothetical protein